jgi:hypothetical protein
MDWKGFGRKKSLPNRGIILLFGLRGIEETKVGTGIDVNVRRKEENVCRSGAAGPHNFATNFFYILLLFVICINTFSKLV